MRSDARNAWSGRRIAARIRAQFGAIGLVSAADLRNSAPVRPPIAFDSVSPQSPLVGEACAWLATELAAPPAPGAPPETVAAFVERVEERVVALCDAQPAMATFLAVGTRLLGVAEKAALEGVSAADARARVLTALATWRADFAQATEAVARQAQSVLPASGWVATTTRSSLVENALLLAHAEGRPVHVLLAESRPMNEGRGLATALAGAGVPTWFAVDGALPLLLPQAGAFLVGADAVREKSFLAKAGTYALLLVARELNLPAYVLAQRAKFVSDRCTRLTLPRRDAAEVWPDAPAGVLVVNAPFEEAPLGLVRGVVTESGFLGPREIEEAAGAALIASALRAGPGPR
jgi:translation initiation factor 2B subunit (eIF-2B alpha/beta/delta family)